MSVVTVARLSSYTTKLIFSVTNAESLVMSIVSEKSLPLYSLTEIEGVSVSNMKSSIPSTTSTIDFARVVAPLSAFTNSISKS